MSSPRILTCKRTGQTFEYRGVGRPPLYCPAVAAEVRKEQRKSSAAKRRAASAAAAAL